MKKQNECVNNKEVVSMSNYKKRFDPNTLMIGGRLTRDPELRYNSEQKPYTFITVANNQGERTNFISIPIWGQQAENICRYLKKGRYVIVEGRLMSYDKGEGNQRETVLIVGFPRVYFMPDGKGNGGKKDNSEPFGGYGDYNDYPSFGSDDGDSFSANISEDDIPF